MWVQSLGWEDPLEEDMAPHSSLVGNSPLGCRVGHHWRNLAYTPLYNQASWWSWLYLFIMAVMIVSISQHQRFEENKQSPKGYWSSVLCKKRTPRCDSFFKFMLRVCLHRRPSPPFLSSSPQSLLSELHDIISSCLYLHWLMFSIPVHIDYKILLLVWKGWKKKWWGILTTIVIHYENHYWEIENKIYLFNYWVLVVASRIFHFLAACRIFCCGMWTLSCSMWDLVPWPGMEPGPPALETPNFSHCTTREVPTAEDFNSSASFPKCHAWELLVGISFPTLEWEVKCREKDRENKGGEERVSLSIMISYNLLPSKQQDMWYSFIGEAGKLCQSRLHHCWFNILK